MKYDISTDKVVAMYETLAGKNFNLSEGQLFCATACGVISGWIDTSKVDPACADQICYAAACMANYRRVLKASEAASDLKAGDISVKDCSEKSIAVAKKLYDDAVEAISFMLKPKRFAFLSVKG